MADNTRHDAVSRLTEVFVNYFIYKKEYSSIPLGRIMKEALYTALGGLDDNYHNSEFIHNLSNEFNEIGLLLEKISNEEYKSEQAEKGIIPTKKQTGNLLLVKDVAQRLGITNEAVLKKIRTGKMNAQKCGKSYLISEEALSTFIESKKRK